MIEQGDAVADLGDAFKRLNKDAVGTMNAMRKASDGAFDDAQIQRMANKMSVARLSAEQMGRAMGVAMKMSAASGDEYLQVAERVSKMLAAGRVEQAAEMGVVVNATEAKERFARESGKVASALTEQEKAAAVAAEALRELEKRYAAVDASGVVSEVEKTQSAWRNLVNYVSVQAAETGDDFARFIFKMADAAEALRDVEVDFAEGMRDLDKEIWKSTEIMKANAALDAYADKVYAASRAQAQAAKHGRDLIAAIGGTSNIIPALRQSVSGLAGDLVNVAEAFRKASVEASGVQRWTARVDTLQAEADALKKMEGLLVRRMEIIAKGDAATVAEKAELKAIQAKRMVNALTGEVSASTEYLIQRGIESEAAATFLEEQARLREVGFAALDAATRRPSGGGAAPVAPIIDDLPDLDEIQDRVLAIYATLQTGRARLVSEAEDVRRIAQREAVEQATALEATIAARAEAGMIDSPSALQAQRDAIWELRDARVAEADATLAQYDAQARLRAEESLAALDDLLARDNVRLMADARKAATREIVAQADAIRGLGEGATEAVGQIQALSAALGTQEGLSKRTQLLVANLASVSESVAGIVQATTGGTRELHAAIANTIGATGQMAAGLTKDIGQAAWLMFAFETAAATVSGIGLDFVGLGQHSAKAAVWAGLGISLGVSRSRGGGRGKRAAPVQSLGTAAPGLAQTGGTTVFNVYMGSNNLYATDGPAVGEQIAHKLYQARHTARIPAAMVG